MDRFYDYIIIWLTSWFIFGSLLFFSLLQKYYLCFQKLGALGEEQTSQLQGTSLTILPRLPLQVTKLKWLKRVHRFKCHRRWCISYGLERMGGSNICLFRLIMGSCSEVFDLCLRLQGLGGVLVLQLGKHVTEVGCPAADTFTTQGQVPQVSPSWEGREGKAQLRLHKGLLLKGDPSPSP